MKDIPIIYDKNHYSVIANDVIKGKQEMTLQEARILRLLITQVAKEDKDLKTYECKIKDLAKFLNVDGSNIYREIKSICDSLAQRVVRVGTGNPRNPWQTFSWLQLAKYDGNGTITLMLSEQIKPFVLDLDKYFTQYQLVNVLDMNSFYAIRLYELIKSEEYKAEFGNEYQEYTIDFLREFFCCEKKYSLFSNFKMRVLDIAIKEINEKSDLEIRYTDYIKDGRKVVAIRFWTFDNQNVIRQHQRLDGQLSFLNYEDKL
ncbi:RepB family protein [Bacteroidales bacterium Barb7]|nr:RepB family protein [Bacteroidales bacterium Barb7]